MLQSDTYISTIKRRNENCFVFEFYYILFLQKILLLSFYL
jgi:hypothetical protein